MWVDTHCHLSSPEFDTDRDELWKSAREAGVSALVLPAVDIDDCAAAAACAARYPGVLPAYGLHPFYAAQMDEDDLARLAFLLERDRPCALGEIGLDGIRQDIDPERQKALFLAQLRLARQFDLPVLLHARRALDVALACLRQTRVKGGIAHAFNGSGEQARQLLRLGFCLGFGGVLTYPGSRRIRAMAVALPETALVLETDAPYLPPRWLREKEKARAAPRNTPAELSGIGRRLAALRNVAPEHLAAVTRKNAEALLPELAAQNQSALSE
ncbi:MAG: TatD family hydrolase [Zoogloeaceae bacterium]|jgi:TatD DNase family protein|nr:TatD family hydrolase [Zoogloeaceae bacterium]